MLFRIQSIIRNIVRRKVQSMLVVLVFIIITVIFLIYLASMNHVSSEIKQLSSTLPVRGQIISLDGKNVDDLIISKEKIKNIDEMDLLTDKIYKSRIILSKAETDGDRIRISNSISALVTNTLSAIQDLKTENIKWWKDEGEGILLQEEKKCIVRERSLIDNGWQLGDIISLNQFNSCYDENELRTEQLVGEVAYQIVGAIGDTENERMQGVDLILPYKAVCRVVEDEQMLFFMQSVEFAIKNPETLNEVKAQLESHKYLEVIANALPRKSGNAIVIDDSIYVKAATQLLDNLNVEQNLFFPFTGAMMMIIYFVSYLLIQSRNQEYYLIRNMGAKKKYLYTTLLLEYGMLMLLGIGIGGALCWKILFLPMHVFLFAVGCISICFFGGVSISILKNGKTKLMLVHSKKD